MLSYADYLNQFLLIGHPATNCLLVGSQIIKLLSGIGHILSPTFGDGGRGLGGGVECGYVITLIFTCNINDKFCFDHVNA